MQPQWHSDCWEPPPEGQERWALSDEATKGPKRLQNVPKESGNVLDKREQFSEALFCLTCL